MHCPVYCIEQPKSCQSTSIASRDILVRRCGVITEACCLITAGRSAVVGADFSQQESDFSPLSLRPAYHYRMELRATVHNYLPPLPPTSAAANTSEEARPFEYSTHSTHTVQHHTGQCSAVQYSTVQYSTVQLSTV